MRASRSVLRLFCAALALLSVLAAGPVRAQDGDEGLLTRTLQTLLSDAGREVRIRGFEGALSSRATIREMSIADDVGVWLVLSDVVLDWNRAALLERRVAVNELSAGRIEILRAPGTDSDGLPSATARPEFALPELPVAVDIGMIRAGEVVVGAPLIGTEARFTLDGTLQLAGGAGQARIVSERIDGQDGRFHLFGRFDNTDRRLTLDLDMSEGRDGIAAAMLGIPDRPALALRIQGDGPLETFRADIAMQSDGTDRLSGAISFDATEDLGFSLDIAGDLRPLLTPDLHMFFGAESRLRTRGVGRADGTWALEELTANTRTLRLVGRAELAADLQPVLIDVIADVAGPDGASVLLPGTDGAARVRGAALSIEYDLGQGSDWTVLAQTDGLQLPEAGVERIAFEAHGRLVPPGTAGADAPFEGIFDFAAEGVSAADPALAQALGQNLFGFLSLRWPGPGTPLEIGGLALEGETLALSAYGTLRGLNFDGFVEAEVPDLEALSGLAGRPLGGHALATLRGQYGFATTAADLALTLAGSDLTVDQAEIDNLLAGSADISLRVRRDLVGTRIDALSVRAGSLVLAGDARFTTEHGHLRAQAELPDLSVLGAGYAGRLTLEADLDSAAGIDRLQLAARGRNLNPGTAAGPAAALLGGDGAFDLNLTRQGGAITLNALTFRNTAIDLDGRGRWSDAEIDLALLLSRLDLSALLPDARGALQGRARLTGTDGALRRVDLDMANAGRLTTGQAPLDRMLAQGLRLVAAVDLPAAGGLRIERADLTAAGLTARIEGSQSADGSADLRLRAQLDSLARAVPGIEGAALAEARLTRSGADLPYGVTFTLGGPSDLSASGSGTIAPNGHLDISASGTVNAAIANPTMEPVLVNGAIRFDARLQGPPGPQALRATARLSGGRFVSPAAGVTFQNIEASARLTGLSAEVDVRGEGQRGGRASLTGRIDIDARRDADLTVGVERLRIAVPQLFDAALSGTARLTGPTATAPRLAGAVTVDEAEIRIPNSPLGRQGYIPDGLQHVGESAASRATRTRAGIATGERFGPAPAAIALDLALNAPGRVFVRGRGLDAELGGTLRLGGSTRDVIPAGSFGLIRGRLDFLGNRFDLTEGSASLVGSFIPYIRLVASSESDGVQTSVIVEGEATAPEIRFASTPELPQDEILARLVFRRALSNLSPFQAAQLALSVATLTGMADNSIIGRTRTALGLDDLDFTTDAAGTTALRLGRYVNERVYTDVQVDTTGRGQVSINLDLTPSVTLRGRTNTEGRSAVGIFFERDY